jgi:hypothetical protein
VTSYKSDTRIQSTKPPRTRYGAGGLQVGTESVNSQTVNRALGAGHLAIQYVQGDGPAGRRNSHRHRGRDAEAYDRLGFDRNGLNDNLESAASLGIRY